MSEWQALSGRITLFPSGPPTSPLPSAEDMFRKVWGIAPQMFQQQQNPLTPGIAQGTRGQMNLNCLVHPSRVDVTLTPPIADTGELKVAFIEDTNELFAEFARIIDSVNTGPVPTPISRVGLSMQIATTVQGSEEGNNVVTQAMPEEYRVKLTNEEDFIFHVNRQRKSEVIQNVTMNFISKWSVDNVQVFRMFPGTITFPAAPQMQTFKVASLTLDYNNVPAERQLNLEEQSQLLRECLTEAEKTLKSHRARAN